MQEYDDDGSLIDVPNQREVDIPEPEAEHSYEVGKAEHVALGVDVDEHQPEVEPDHEVDETKSNVHADHS